MLKKQWVFKDNTYSAISNNFGLSPLTFMALYNRDIVSENEIKAFLENDEKDLYDPFLLKDMDKAVKRIEKAIENSEKIVVYGDYDVDGITATTILSDYLKGRTPFVEYYIPNRQDEGYGINLQAIEAIAQSGAGLMISVDCGITAVLEVEKAKELGLDIIVTDHHSCKDTLPKAVAVIDPKRQDCNYPFVDLAGVGVAFKLICALHGSNEEPLKRYADLVALGTIADIVSLKDENRVIAAKGLEKIRNNPNIGIGAILEVAGRKKETVDTKSVGYVIAPRINAAGRLLNAQLPIKLLMCKDSDEAVNIASSLEIMNRERQECEKAIYEEAISIIEQKNLHENKVIVLAKDGWHQGVIGIVASHIVSKYYRPAIIISLDGDVGKGSARSIEGFNLFEAMGFCEKDLIGFGGHAMAAGINIENAKIEQFDKEMNAFIETIATEQMMVPKIYIDAKLKEEDLNIKTALDLEKLEPHGYGNPVPVFALMNTKILSIKQLSGGKHLKMKLKSFSTMVDAIGFSMGDRFDEFKEGDKVDIAGFLKKNEYNNNLALQIEIKDIRISENIDREKLGAVYKLLKNRADEENAIVLNISDTEKSFKICLDIFEEIGLLSYSEKNGNLNITINKIDGKLDLMQSKSFREKAI